MLGLLPTLLVEQAGLGVRAAGQWTALAALSAVLGSLAAAVACRRCCCSVSSRRRRRRPGPSRWRSR
ncbi:hypothetical protein ABXN37_23460 [Piscinibacter sakaiensis]|uniref:hypothetical protein n=1 Tax=Piscinibacter sakaiensis TaxID=1547922 RepID=UPI00372AAAD0